MGLKDKLFSKGLNMEERHKTMEENLQVWFENELWPLMQKYPNTLTNAYVNESLEELIHNLEMEGLTSLVD